MPAVNHVEARRGWRIALLLVHIASMILVAAALSSTVGERTHVEPMLFRGALVYSWGMSTEQMFAVMFMDQWGTFGQLCLLALGIYLAGLIGRGDQRVPHYYVWYGVALVVFEAVLGRTEHRLWDAPRGTTDASRGLYVAVIATALVACAACLSRSKGVRATLVHEPRPMGPMWSLLIGCGALALITWPFLLNGLLNATSRVAAYISPRDTTAGEGFAEGIMAASVATGLLLLMKHAWHLRTKWVAVLLPVGFAALVVLYQAQTFSLHWTF